MNRFRLAHILLCAWICFFLGAVQGATQDYSEARVLPAPYQEWLDEDVRYLITEEERAEFEKLVTSQERDKFISDFWESRNPNPGLPENKFKKEHYRRLAYVNQHFAAKVAGYKTDRGRIYILYGRPDELEHRPANPHLPADVPLSARYAKEIWRYNWINGIGRNVFFGFVDHCGCEEYQLVHDPTKKRPSSPKDEVRLVPVKTFLGPR